MRTGILARIVVHFWAGKINTRQSIPPSVFIVETRVGSSVASNYPKGAHYQNGVTLAICFVHTVRIFCKWLIFQKKRGICPILPCLYTINWFTCIEKTVILGLLEFLYPAQKNKTAIWSRPRHFCKVFSAMQFTADSQEMEYSFRFPQLGLSSFTSPLFLGGRSGFLMVSVIHTVVHIYTCTYS